MKHTITVESDEEDVTAHSCWLLPFNNINPRNAKSIFFYLKNTGSSDIRLDWLSISSSMQASNIQLHTVLGEPSFIREDNIRPVNKQLSMNRNLPDIDAKSCADANDLSSIGQLDLLQLPKELTSYKLTNLNITISPESTVVLTASSDLGELSGIVHISEKEE